ncbi:uncharacterized protein TNCV_2222771 [Trichonephila clavipes]|nr:uncharacterized protein TNCV_2222771 [Trichonephila clavipes]
MGARLRALKNNLKIHQAVRQQTDIWTRKADGCRNSSAAKILWPSHKKKCWKISRRYVQNPSGQHISINCRQMKIHNMLCALWEKKVGAGTIKALYQNFAQMGVMDAVICFNEGAYARTEVLKALKINPGVNTCEGLRKIDYVRICEAEMAVQKASKEARTTKRQIKRKQGALEQSMQDEYSAGNC